MRKSMLAILGLASLVVPLLVVPLSALAEQPDGRTRISLAASEREHIRAGMRKYLESVQGIVEGLAQHKMPVVASSASKSGTASVGDVPVALALKLPPDFVAMSLDTHQKFDELAKAARERAGKLAITKGLNDILVTCVSCHAYYRF